MEPKTKLDVSEEEAEQIRSKVRNMRSIKGVLGSSRLAVPADAAAILELLKDERVSAPVYTLPRPFSIQSITDWIEDHQRQAQLGEGLLMLTEDNTGQVLSISDFQFWPEYSACEFGGVIAAHLQSQSYGTKGIRDLCDWCFEVIGVRLLALTSALDNIRTQKILEGLGCTLMGEIDSVRPDGSVRKSLYWELLREN